MRRNASKEITFDSTRAQAWWPRPVIKYAVLVPIPHRFPTFLRPEWDTTGNNPQVSRGSYYLIIDQQGQGRYLSEKTQWEGMHTRIDLQPRIRGVPAMAWVKTSIPVGYHVDQGGLIRTTLAGVEESLTEIAPGTLVLRQPGGEFQFVRPEDEGNTYFTQAEARVLGLEKMSPHQFAQWTVMQAMYSLRP